MQIPQETKIQLPCNLSNLLHTIFEIISKINTHIHVFIVGMFIGAKIWKKLSPSLDGHLRNVLCVCVHARTHELCSQYMY